MIEALIAGERDPRVLAVLAKGLLRKKHDQLVEALTGRFDDHHAELAQLLLDQIDGLSANIDALTHRIDQLIAEIPAAWKPLADHPGSGGDPNGDPTTRFERLDASNQRMSASTPSTRW